MVRKKEKNGHQEPSNENFLPMNIQHVKFWLCLGGIIYRTLDWKLENEDANTNPATKQAVWLEPHHLSSFTCKMRHLQCTICNFPASSKGPWCYCAYWITCMSKRSAVLENTRNYLWGEERKVGWRMENWRGDFLPIEKRHCYAP